MRNLHLTFVLVVPVKSKVEISQNFVAFSEYMNFNKIQLLLKLTKNSKESFWCKMSYFGNQIVSLFSVVSNVTRLS